MTVRLVERRQDDVEPLENAIAEVQASICEDVDLAPMQDRQLRKPLAHRRDLVGLSP